MELISGSQYASDHRSGGVLVSIYKPKTFWKRLLCFLRIETPPKTYAMLFVNEQEVPVTFERDTYAGVTTDFCYVTIPFGRIDILWDDLPSMLKDYSVSRVMARLDN